MVGFIISVAESSSSAITVSVYYLVLASFSAILNPDKDGSLSCVISLSNCQGIPYVELILCVKLHYKCCLGFCRELGLLGEKHCFHKPSWLISK
jgi:hypothetical protein